MPISLARLDVRRRTLIDAACSLIRQNGNAGFSMTQLAERAGVSPATPYNLLGTKTELLRLVLRDEFDRFTIKLESRSPVRPLAGLLTAIDLVVAHYQEDPAFYRGLVHASLSTDRSELRELMFAEGRALWQGLVQSAIDSEELHPSLAVTSFTDVLLRLMSSTTQAWLAEEWTSRRFSVAMKHASRIAIASVSAPPNRDILIREILQLQVELLE